MTTSPGSSRPCQNNEAIGNAQTKHVYPSSPEAVKPLLPGLESSPDARNMVERYGMDRWNKEKLAARFLGHAVRSQGAATAAFERAS